MSTLRRRTLSTPVGVLVLVASDRGLRAVLWPDDDPARVPSAVLSTATATATSDPIAGPTSGPAPRATPDGAGPGGNADAVLAAAADQLREFFDERRDAFDLPLDPVGTDFQVSVWRELAAIPTGTTITYGELARRVGRPAAARAVGAAVGRNPLSVVLPCHRVVGSDGRMTGFAGGLAAKRWLLRHEGALLA